MRFTVSDHFDAPVERVEAAVLDGEYQRRLADLPNVAERRVKVQEEQPDGSVRRVVHYRFSGSVPSAARGVIGGDEISWDERAIFDPVRHEWRFEIDPHVAERSLTCRGTYRFTANGDGSTRRDVDVELDVKVPIVGRAVEGVIAGGLRDTLAAEHRILAEFLRERG